MRRYVHETDGTLLLIELRCLILITATDARMYIFQSLYSVSYIFAIRCRLACVWAGPRMWSALMQQCILSVRNQNVFYSPF